MPHEPTDNLVSMPPAVEQGSQTMAAPSQMSPPGPEADIVTVAHEPGRLVVPPAPSASSPGAPSMPSLGGATIPDEEELYRGVSIGPYQIIEKVGHGAMGLVFRARHATLGRMVALKVMRPEISQNQDFVQRFLREARASAAVDHPNVVTVYDAGSEKGCLYMALKFVDGGSLHDLVKQQGRLPESRAMDVACDLLLGLNALHKAGLIHRDIKPANILIDSNTGSALLTDMGLARAVSKDDHLTQAGVPLGTPAYMSPEQARGKGEVDIRSDIYSVGVTLYACLTGAVPFRGSSAFETVAMVMYEEPPDPRKFMPDLSDDVISVMLKAMRKKAEDRYQTPMEMYRDLKALLQGDAPSRATFIPAPHQAVEVRQKHALPPVALHRQKDPDSALNYEASPVSNVAPLGEDSSSGGGTGSSGAFSRWFKNFMGTSAPNRTSAGREDSSKPGSSSASTPGTAEEEKKKKKRVRMYRGQIIED
jgi:serine/threonine protein kinase